MTSVWRSRSSWFLVGAAAGAAVFAIEAIWREAVRASFGWPHFVYDRQPLWLQSIYERLWWLPWLLGLALIVVRIRRGPSVRLGAYAAGAATPYALAVSLLLAQPALAQWRHERSFDPVAWQSATAADDPMWPARLRMVDDLLARHRLMGMPRDSAIALLGRSDSTGYWREWDLVYHLGPERGLFGIDSERLVVRFGEDERVTEARIVRD